MNKVKTKFPSDMPQTFFMKMVFTMLYNGYDGDLYLHNGGYHFISNKRSTVVFAMCEKGSTPYLAIDGKIAFEHKDYFDKWSKCSHQFDIPTTSKERINILNLLEKESKRKQLN